MKKGFVFRWISTSVALIIVTYLVDGIEIKNIPSAFIASLLLGIVNAFIRPVIMFFTLPFTVFTFGFFILVVNGSMLYLVSWLVSGFVIQSFWSAIVGSMLISILSSFFNYIIGDEGKVETIHFTSTARHYEDSVHNPTYNHNDEKIIDADYRIVNKEEKEKK